MSETVYTIKEGSLVQCRDTDRIGFVVRAYITDKDFMCHVSWGTGETSHVPSINLEQLDKS
jgi:hypothetical protein